MKIKYTTGEVQTLLEYANSVLPTLKERVLQNEPLRENEVSPDYNNIASFLQNIAEETKQLANSFYKTKETENVTETK